MDPFAQLLTQSSGSQVAPETLEMLARQASQMFQSQGIPLNQAVTQVVANHPELGNEHVKRIIEFANTVTFQEMFQNSEDKNIHFEVADPGAILRDLKDGGSPAHDGKPLGMSDYKLPPEQQQSNAIDQAFDAQFLGSEKNANLKNLGDYAHKAKKNAKALAGAAALGGAAYAGARGVKRLIDGPKTKTASEIREELAVDHERHANPVEDAYDAHVRLKASREKLATSYESMDGVLKQAKADFYNEIKAEVLDPDGAGLGGVIAVLEKIAEQDIVEALLGPVTEQLVRDGIQTHTLNTSLKKTAGVVVNLEHPILALADSIVKVAGEMVRCSSAIDELDGLLEQTGALFKRAGALTNGVRDAIDHKGNLPAGIRQRFPRT
jgi:hypothetical protein